MNIENGIPLKQDLSLLLFNHHFSWTNNFHAYGSRYVQVCKNVVASYGLLSWSTHKGFLHNPLFVVSWSTGPPLPQDHDLFFPCWWAAESPQQKRCKGNSVWGDTSHVAPAAPRPLSSRAPRFAQQWLLPMGCSKRPGIYQPIKSGSLKKNKI